MGWYGRGEHIFRCEVARLTAIVGLVGLSLAMASCTQENGDKATARSSNDTMPTIYVDRLVEYSSREAQKGGYLQALANCREGGVPTVPLSEEEVAKIGTERRQFWRTPERRAYRVEAWEWYSEGGGARVDPAARCEFSLSVTGQHGYLDAQQSVYIELDSNEKSVDPPTPQELEGLEVVQADAPDEEDLVMARDFGATGPVMRTVAGQPCQEWTYPDGATVCTWSGGSESGFSYGPDAPFRAVNGIDLDSIVLHAEPPPGQSRGRRKGDRLTTVEFSINAPLNLNDMKAVGAGDQPENRGP